MGSIQVRQGRSWSEIADELGCKPTTARRRFTEAPTKKARR